MTFIRRNILYFQNTDPSNAKCVIEAVKERLNLGGIEAVLIPITTGKTAELFSDELKGKAGVIGIPESEVIGVCNLIARSKGGFFGSLVDDRLAEATERLRREAFDIVLLPFCGENWDAAKELFHVFGQGMKVALEITIAAVELKKIPSGTRVISVGGTKGGADTAIVVKTSMQSEAFGSELAKRLSIEEILAMPLQKW